MSSATRSHAAAVPAQPGAKTWERVASLLRPWRGLLLGIGLTVLVAKALDLVPPLLVQRIIDDHLTPGRPAGLLELGVLYLGATVAAQGVQFVAVYLTAVAAQGALHALRVRLFTHLQALPVSYYDQTPLGDVISRCTADVDTVDTLFSSGVINLVANLVRLGTAGVTMVALSAPLALVVLLVVPPLAAITRFFQVRVRAAERRNRQAIGLLNTHLQETLSGVEVIRAFGREATFVARFREALREALAASNRSALYSSLYTPIMAVLAAVVTALLLWVGASGILAGWGVSLGTLTAFVLLFGRFFEPITALGDDWQTVQSALAGIERIVRRPGPARRSPPPGGAPDARCARGHGARPGLRLQAGRARAARGLLHSASRASTSRWSGARARARAACSTCWVASTRRGPARWRWSGRIRAAWLMRSAAGSWGSCRRMVQLFSGAVWDNLTLGDPTVSLADGRARGAHRGRRGVHLQRYRRGIAPH